MDNSVETRIFEFGGFHLDAAKRQLTGPDGVVEVPSRAFDVLLYMVAHPGEALDKTRLLKAVWPSTVVEEGNLSQCIFALRRAFGDTATEHRFIATIPGRGYQFVAQVRETAAVIASPAVARRGSRRLLYAGAAVMLVALLLSIRFWPAAAPAKTSDATPAPAPAPPSIAVLPFADLSPGKDMEYFADGLADELMSSLSKVHGIRIISRHSSFAFKGKSDDARSIGEKLRVETILEGAVRKAGDRLRITAQLTRTRDGVSLWAETYDRQFDDVLDVQGSIAREVAAALVPVVQRPQGFEPPGYLDAPLTQDAEAYRAYLRGLYFFARWIDRDPKPARNEFLRAVERDPHFAKAYAMLARTYQLSANLGIGDVTVAQGRSLAAGALDKALKLDPTIDELWWVKMMFVEKNDGPAAVRATELERAIAANPTDIEPMISLAYTYFQLGKPDLAMQMFERAYAADPFSPVANYNVAWFGYALHGDRQRLLDLTDEMERLEPHDAQLNWTRADLAFNEGRALDWDGFVARVIGVEPGNHQIHAWLSNSYGSLGAFDAALYHARTCAKLDPKAATCAYSIARIEMRSGDLVAARETVLEAAKHDPQNSQVQLAQGELQYFNGDCAGALRSIAQARPYYDKPEAALNLLAYSDNVAVFAWCLRQQGETARLAAMNRVFNLQYAQTATATAAVYVGIRARMAAATGDRDALVANLTALANSSCPDTAFVRHEPMIRPWLKDAEVVALLDKLEARQAEWLRILPRASMRVPVPGVSAGS